MPNRRITIIGGGLAGLRCAKELEEENFNVTLMEASDRLGGRIKSDNIEGHILDHGLQALLTSYPEAQATWNYPSLELSSFRSGAKVWDGKNILEFPDPWKNATSFWAAFTSTVMPFCDKLRLAKLRIELKNPSQMITKLKGRTTIDFLRNDCHFSERAITHFLKPFFSGIFLDKELSTSAQMFAYLFPLFAKGDVSFPKDGMEALIKQLSNQLPSTTIKLNSKVESINETTVFLSSGERVEADYLIVATGQSTANQWYPELEERKWNGTQCFYYSLPEDHLQLNKTILLNADPDCPHINSISPISEVAPSYAPRGKKLIAVSTILDAEKISEEKIRNELIKILGEKAKGWNFLKSYHLPQSLPNQANLDFEAPPFRKLGKKIFLCGDSQRHSSIQGALESGKAVVQAIAKS